MNHRAEIVQPQDPGAHPEQAASTAGEELRARYKWREVQKPQIWKAKEGDEVVGYYGGKTSRRGRFGDFDVAILHVPHSGAVLLSGVEVLNLIDSAGAQVGDPLRVEFLGYKDLGDDRRLKKYRVFVADGEPVDPEHLPEVN